MSSILEDLAAVMFFLADMNKMAYSRDAVCIIVTVRAMISHDCSSTRNQTLNACINCLRISFPGSDAI